MRRVRKGGLRPAPSPEKARLRESFFRFRLAVCVVCGYIVPIPLTEQNMISVKMPDGSTYEIKSLLADGDSNAKLTKSNKSGKGYLTFGLSLSPAHTSGYQTCASSSPGCRAACLYTSGHGRTSTVQRCRVAKTIAFFEQREMFMAMLYEELNKAYKKAQKQDKDCAVRLNIVSDVMWETEGVPQAFPLIQFYDYTKHYKRMLKYTAEKLPTNYHLTFSRSEVNEKQCMEVLYAGGNVTVVFDNKNFPKEWNGFPVVNGDETDLRFLDPRQSVVGLYMKGDGKKDTTGFVVNLL